MTTQHSVHAYRQLTDVQLHVRALQDASQGSDLERVQWHDQPEYGKRLIDITESSNWRRLRLVLECSISQEQLASAIGDKESPATAVRCQVTLACRATKLRRAITLHADGAGRFSSVALIDRDDVFSSFDVKARVVRTGDLKNDETGKAQFEGAILGESDPITIVLERSALPYTGQFRVSWKSFSKAEEAELRKAAHAPLFVRTDGPPTVLLNEDFQDLKVILTGNAGSAVEAALRSAFAAMVGASVWRQLVHAALAAASIEQEAESQYVQVPGDWKGAVARQFASFVHPELEANEALLHVIAALKDSSASQGIVSQIGSYADTTSKAKNLTMQAIRNARRIEE